MAHDYARRHPMHLSNAGLPGWVWFLTGLAAGVFGSFLFYLWRDVPVDPAARDLAGRPATELLSPNVEEMKWDFYDLFPKSEVPIVDAYAKDGSKQKVEGPFVYLLQAGSFRNADDADQLRVQLILLGLDVFTRKVKKDGTTWNRVLVGPIDSATEMDRQRRKLAEANIPSIALRVSP